MQRPRQLTYPYPYSCCMLLHAAVVPNACKHAASRVLLISRAGRLHLAALQIQDSHMGLMMNIGTRHGALTCS